MRMKTAHRSRDQGECCWTPVSADGTPHESLLPQRRQSAEPHLLGLLLVHEQLQSGTETAGQQTPRQLAG